MSDLLLVILGGVIVYAIFNQEETMQTVPQAQPRQPQQGQPQSPSTPGSSQQQTPNDVGIPNETIYAPPSQISYPYGAPCHPYWICDPQYRIFTDPLSPWYNPNFNPDLPFQV